MITQEENVQKNVRFFLTRRFRPNSPGPIGTVPPAPLPRPPLPALRKDRLEPLRARLGIPAFPCDFRFTGASRSTLPGEKPAKRGLDLFNMPGFRRQDIQGFERLGLPQLVNRVRVQAEFRAYFVQGDF